MNNYTREDILRMVEEEDVGFIRLQFTDIFGTMKNIAITTSQLEKALDNEIMFDGSSIEAVSYTHHRSVWQLFPAAVSMEISQMYSDSDTDTYPTLLLLQNLL